MPPRKRKAAAIAHDEDQDAAAAASRTPDNSSSRRRSTRVSSSAKKSHYFEGDDDSESDAPKAKSKSNAKANAKAKATIKSTATKGQRGRPKKKAKVDPNPSEDEDDEDVYKDSPDAEDAQDGDDQQESDNDSDSPQITFIPIPKLRDLAGVSYSPTTIHPNTLHFLRDLRANNKRSWLKLHDAEYRRSLSDWESYAMSLTDGIISSCDETIPELPFRDINFRIYRDIRFSKDPTPYKPHYSASWSRTGRKGPYACYYVHLEPGGKCFVGGGLWHPEAQALGALRRSIDERPERWRRVLMDDTFRETFLGSGGFKMQVKKGKGKGKDVKGKKGRGKKAGEEEEEEEEEENDGLDEERAVIKAFCAANAGNALKIKPKVRRHFLFVTAFCVSVSLETGMLNGGRAPRS